MNTHIHQSLVTFPLIEMKKVFVIYDIHNYITIYKKKITYLLFHKKPTIIQHNYLASKTFIYNTDKLLFFIISFYYFEFIFNNIFHSPNSHYIKIIPIIIKTVINTRNIRDKIKPTTHVYFDRSYKNVDIPLNGLSG